MTLQLMCDADGARIRQAAEIQPGTHDHIGERADIRRRKAHALQLPPGGKQIRLLYLCQHQVLIVGDPHLPEAHRIGQLGDRFHLVRGHISRRHPDGFETGEHTRYPGTLWA